MPKPRKRIRPYRKSPGKKKADIGKVILIEKVISKLRDPALYKSLAVFLLLLTLLLVILNMNTFTTINKSRIDITYEPYCFSLDLEKGNRCDTLGSCIQQCSKACPDLGLKHSSTDYRFAHCVCYCA